jgi:hypothetical protein
MRILLIFIGLASIISCNNNKENSTAKDSTVTRLPTKPPVEIPDSIVNVSGCYMKKLSRDIYVLQLEQSGTTVTGKLQFDNYQKDDSKGTVKGIVDENIVKLWYDFTAEGMHSILEKYFKKQGDGLIHGIGDTEVKGDSAFYKNPAAINFEEKQLFTKVDCASIPEKFK